MRKMNSEELNLLCLFTSKVIDCFKVQSETQTTKNNYMYCFIINLLDSSSKNSLTFMYTKYTVIKSNIQFVLKQCCFVGRRHLQVRLVEPSLKSLNSGDCFALVTEKDLFSWIGKDCNPYEKAKVSKRLIYNNILISIFVSLGLSFLTGSL